MIDHESICDLFKSICQQYPSSIAFSCLGKNMTFAELDQLSHNFASYLQHHTTLAPGDRLAVQLPNILQYPVVLFGALRCGVVIVNTNPLYTGRELRHQLVDSGAKVLVVLANLAKAAEAVIDDTNIQQVIVTEVGDLHGFCKRKLINGVLRYIKKEVHDCHFPSSVNFLRTLSLGKRDPLAPILSNLDTIAFLQYTGGTTGIAKGAILTHGNLIANCRQIREFWGDALRTNQEIFLAPLPLYHIYGFTMHCLVVLSLASESVLIPNPRDLPSVIKAFKSKSPTGMVGLNTLFVALGRIKKFRDLNFSSLRVTTSGGMALNESTAKHWQDITGSLPIEGYGLTETSPVVTSNDPNNPKTGTIGLALPQTELKIIDQDGVSLPRGEIGELCVRGPQVTQGYWQRPEETANALSKDGWFQTGDVACIDEEDYVRIVDRKKDMIIVSGFNVYPNEVEEILVSHPDVIEAAVIGVDDKETGEAVKAFIVKTPESELDDDTLRNYCKQQLTAYKVPRLFVYRDSLPKTNVGKVLRRKLREPKKPILHRG